MGRNKIDTNKMIEDPKRRKMCWYKRCGGVCKKAEELKVLCGWDAAHVIFIKSGKRWEYSSSGLPFQPTSGQVYPDDLRGPQSLQGRLRKRICSDVKPPSLSSSAESSSSQPSIFPFPTLPRLDLLPFKLDDISRLMNDYNRGLQSSIMSF